MSDLLVNPSRFDTTPVVDPTTVVVDRFNRSNSTTAMGTAETGQTWTPRLGTWGINNGTAYVVSNVVATTYSTVVDAGVADCTVTVTLAALIAGNGNVGITFRNVDSNNWWRFIADPANSRLYLQRNLAGSPLTYDTINSVTISAGDVLSVVLDGDSIACYHNGVARILRTNSSHNTATHHGLIVSTSNPASNASRWEDFSVTVPAGLATPYSDPFLGTSGVDAASGVSQTINAPTKDPGNPLLPAGTNSDTWDADKLYVSAIIDGSTHRVFYKGWPGGSTLYSCVANTSDRLATYTKPNAGQVTYSGNTNNNIVAALSLSSAYYDTTTAQWVIVTEEVGGVDGLYIYTAADYLGPYTQANYIDPSGYAEGRCVLRLPNGEWVGYYVSGHSGDRRTIYAATQPDGDLAGAWNVVGAVGAFTSSAATRQFYGLAVSVFDGLVYALVQIYDSVASTITSELFTSRDGLTFERAGTNPWLGLGASSAWDDAMVLPAAIIEEGDDWLIYYGGSPALHSSGFQRDSRIGLATVPKGRTGQYAGTGTITTVPLRTTAGDTITINCDASGGSVEVEVLDSVTDIPLSGFAQADAIAVTTDTYGATVSWSAGSALPGADVKLRFHLTDATLHGYSVA